jgi:hypothetical protein
VSDHTRSGGRRGVRRLSVMRPAHHDCVARCLDTTKVRRSSADTAPAAVDLRVASVVASNGVLRMRALSTVFIVTCTDKRGEHSDSDEFGTRNASLIPIKHVLVDPRFHYDRYKVPSLVV